MKPHGVDGTNSNTWTCVYDCNGNVTARNVGSGKYALTYNAGNKLATASDGSTTTTYTYDGDGTLVMKADSGQTTVYVEPLFEKNLTTGVVTKYYYLSGQRVAMRADSSLSYLHGDHGSRRRELAARF